MGGEPDPAPVDGPGFDLLRPHPARIYDHWLGGKDAFGPDRAAAEKVAQAAPWVVAGARGNRAFLRRAVTHLARAGVEQYLDLGSGLPTSGNVHEIAQRINPTSKVVYVDLDPVVLVHARALLATNPATIAVAGDLRTPHTILNDPEVGAHLDLRRPVAVLFLAVLHFVREQEDPAGIVGAFREVLAPGSHIAISHVADLPGHENLDRAAATREAAEIYREVAAPFVLRTQAQVTALFDGFDLLEPGVVPVHVWRPNRGRLGPAVPVLGGVGRLPASPQQVGTFRSGPR